MAFFMAVTFAGGALAIGVTARRKADPLRLVDVLIDGEPKRATLLPPQTQQALTRVKTVSQDLFGDTRQQQQQALNTTYAGDEEQTAETTARQNLIVTTTGLGLATAGILLSPLFYLPSAFCALYATRMFFRDAWDVYQREKRLDYRAIWALTVPVALAGGYVWAANFG
ncbi:MAG: hypothetical protein KDE58_16455, partial [Caldilineaceae bacterium]|nr:hypothetical protein [Caldilineaceae bacterium]